MENKTYTKNAHSVCCLTYHAVFVIKYRRKVITPEILAFMRSHTDYLISQRYHGKLWNSMGKKTISISYLNFHHPLHLLLLSVI